MINTLKVLGFFKISPQANIPATSKNDVTDKDIVAGGRAKEVAEWHKQGKEGNKRPYR